MTRRGSRDGRRAQCNGNRSDVQQRGGHRHSNCPIASVTLSAVLSAHPLYAQPCLAALQLHAAGAVGGDHLERRRGRLLLLLLAAGGQHGPRGCCDAVGAGSQALGGREGLGRLQGGGRSGSMGATERPGCPRHAIESCTKAQCTAAGGGRAAQGAAPVPSGARASRAPHRTAHKLVDAHPRGDAQRGQLRAQKGSHCDSGAAGSEEGLLYASSRPAPSGGACGCWDGPLGRCLPGKHPCRPQALPRPLQGPRRQLERRALRKKPWR